MALVGSSVLYTPGSGETLAFENINSKKHQAVVLCDAFGHIIGSRDTYAIAVLDYATAPANRRILSVWNANAAGIVLEVCYAVVVRHVTAAIAGLVRGYRLLRISGSAPTGGTAVTPEEFNTAQTLPANITCLHGATADIVPNVEGTVPVGITAQNEDEAAAAGAYPGVLYAEQDVREPIILAQNQGVVIKQDGTAAVGVASGLILFRAR